MRYQSTRGFEKTLSASEAILKGLAPDGGLYVPIEIPTYPLSKESFLNKSYQELAYEIMQPLLSDFTEDELRDCINQAYDEKFDDTLIAPLRKIGNDYYLELFHGSTLAFKDMALSILPYLMTTSLKKQQVEEEIVILTATSGDTGKAAMEGFSDVEGTKIIVFYPKNGVSEIQEKQMLTQKGDNTFVIGINGNFDDAQKRVKAMISDETLKTLLKTNHKQFSSANSINIGRLVPQIVYYFYAYQQLIKLGEIEFGDKINVSVPTGNFGNILAAYYAKKMGLPINVLICASNKNNVLTDFFNSGTYDKNREFFVTNSPSMDILISSNLERLLFYVTNQQSARLRELMTDLENKGTYQLTDSEKSETIEFYAGFATEEEIEKTVKDVLDKEQYVIDPHTAVAKKVADDYEKETGDKTKTVIISTASPYKFPQLLTGELGQVEEVNRLFELTQLAIPKPILELEQLKNREETVIKLDDMTKTVLNILGIED